MKRILVPLLLGLAMGAATVWFGWRRPEPVARPSDATMPAELADSDALHLDQAAQARVGLVVQPLGTTNAAVRIRGDARVLEASLLLQHWNDLALARLAQEASRKEWERLTILFSQGQNASARALEAGEAARKRDEALVLGAETRLAATWGQVLAGRADLATLVRQLSHFETALVRFEFPLGVRWDGVPHSVVVNSWADPAQSIPVEWLGPAPTTDPLTQGSAFLGLVLTNTLTPGSALTAFVTTAAPARVGVFLPASAIVRQEGESFVYELVDADHFVRLPVTIEQPLNGGWLVTSGLTNDQKIVVTGAQVLLSLESKSRGSEE